MTVPHPQPLHDDSAPHERARSSRPAILVAEDDPELRTLIAETLRDDGCEVTEVVDGGRLLVRVAHELGTSSCPQGAFDLIISDICMPVCTGLQILEGLRRAHRHTPVILMTAFDDSTTRGRAESLGAVLFTKPFDLDDLKTAIVNLLPPTPSYFRARARHDSGR